MTREKIDKEITPEEVGTSQRRINSMKQELPKESFWRLTGSFPNISDLFIIYGVFIIAQLLGQFIAYLFGLRYDSSLLNSADEQTLYSAQYAYGLFSLVSYASAMVITTIFVVLFKRLRGDRGSLLKVARGANLAHITLWGVILTLCLGVVLEPLMAIMPKVPEYSGRGIPAIISLIVIAPIFEEFICRGVLLESLRRKGGVVLALFISSLFFALLHAHVTLFLNAFIMGLMLGYFYIRTRSIIVPIILHAINNTVAYILLYTNNADFSLSDIILNRNIYYIVYSSALFILIISAIKIGRKVNLINKAD